ncbi:MAG: hypothetical protein WCF05_08650, partial [Chromatiaceae bacterium]
MTTRLASALRAPRPGTRARAWFEGSVWALALALALGCPAVSLAAEGGMGHHLPGGTATLIDLAPAKPGWVIEPMYLHYEGNASASKAIPIAGTLA